MDLRLYPLLQQVFLQSVPLLTEDRENVIDVLVMWQPYRQGHCQMADSLIIEVCDVLTSLVIVIKMTQLDIEHGSLYLVQTAVATRIPEHVLALAAIIGQRTDSSSQRCVVTRHGTAIAQSAQILSRIEAVPGSIAQRACTTTVDIAAAMGLGVIFHQLEVVFPAVGQSSRYRHNGHRDEPGEWNAS